MCSVSTILLSLRVVQHKYWNLAISLHRGISIVTVVLPLTVTFNFNRSSLAFQCTLQRSIFLTISHFSPSKCGMNFSATISKTILNFREWGNFYFLFHPHDYDMQNQVICYFVWEYLLFILLWKLNSVLYSIWQYFFLDSLHELNRVLYYQYFSKSRSHIFFILRFVCNFLFFLNSLSV